MKIYQSRSFEKKIKRMHKREKEILDQEMQSQNDLHVTSEELGARLNQEVRAYVKAV